MNTQQHPYHIVNMSCWPILISLSMLFLTSGTVMYLHGHHFGEYILGTGAISLIFCLYNWWGDVISEGKGHHHTEAVRRGLSIGMALFILSEIMFFFAFFCSFFKASLFPAWLLDGIWATSIGTWPPPGIKTLDAWDIPFTNTLILLLSGTTVTWAHYALLEGNRKDTITALSITVFLGVCFSFLQAYEYHHAGFKLTSGIYGSNFYLATGFHGLHVLIGTIFLAINLIRVIRGDFSNGNGHLGFEFAAWYWHFVDVVWLLLFAFVYVWGG